MEAGKLEEARATCAEQMEEAHGQLKADDAFRAEYFALWETQRKQPVHAGEACPRRRWGSCAAATSAAVVLPSAVNLQSRLAAGMPTAGAELQAQGR